MVLVARGICRLFKAATLLWQSRCSFLDANQSAASIQRRCSCKREVLLDVGQPLRSPKELFMLSDRRAENASPKSVGAGVALQSR